MKGWWSRGRQRAVRGNRRKEMEVQRDVTLAYIWGALLNI